MLLSWVVVADPRHNTNSIMAYKVPWGQKVEFPFKSKEEMGIKNQEAFLAIQKIFIHLDNVFRGRGNQNIPQRHSTVAAHEVGLMKLGRDFVFDPLRQLHGAKPDFNKREKNFNGMAIFHDAAELIGEISTFAQRLTGEVDGLTEEDRFRLEERAADISFYLALKSIKENNAEILDKPIKDLQAFTSKEENQYNRYFYIKENFVDKFEHEVKKLDGKDSDLKEAHQEILTLYNEMERATGVESPGEKDFDGILLRFLEKLESVYYVSHKEVGDYSDDNKAKTQVSAFNKPKKLFEKLVLAAGKNNLLIDMANKAKDFYNLCINQFKSRSDVFKDLETI